MIIQITHHCVHTVPNTVIHMIIQIAKFELKLKLHTFAPVWKKSKSPQYFILKNISLQVEFCSIQLFISDTIMYCEIPYNLYFVKTPYKLVTRYCRLCAE